MKQALVKCSLPNMSLALDSSDRAFQLLAAQEKTHTIRGYLMMSSLMAHICSRNFLLCSSANSSNSSTIRTILDILFSAISLFKKLSSMEKKVSLSSSDALFNFS